MNNLQNFHLIAVSDTIGNSEAETTNELKEETNHINNGFASWLWYPIFGLIILVLVWAILHFRKDKKLRAKVK